jgi:hypothetical protein
MEADSRSTVLPHKFLLTVALDVSAKCRLCAKRGSTKECFMTSGAVLAAAREVIAVARERPAKVVCFPMSLLPFCGCSY